MCERKRTLSLWCESIVSTFTYTIGNFGSSSSNESKRNGKCIPVQAVSPRGRFFADQTFHFETLRNAGCAVARCADLGEMPEATKQITEGDLESWYTAWSATADRVEVWLRARWIQSGIAAHSWA